MSWVSPIFDRTYNDVLYAIEKINEWKESASPTTTDLKACLNYGDLNRIEGNLDYLQNEFNNVGYSITLTIKTWSDSGLPNIDDFDRIIGNITTLYSQITTPPTMPSNMVNYEDINKMEKLIFDIKVLLEDMISEYQKCGVAICGARRMLPLRRS